MRVTYADGYSNGNSDRHSHGNGYRNCNCNCDCNRNCGAQVYTNSKATSHSEAKAVTKPILGNAGVLLAPSGILPDGSIGGCALDYRTMTHELVEHFV